MDRVQQELELEPPHVRLRSRLVEQGNESVASYVCLLYSSPKFMSRADDSGMSTLEYLLSSIPTLLHRLQSPAPASQSVWDGEGVREPLSKQSCAAKKV